jgi:succinate dehydrogenase / fumarate reductase iron-sulfur subunit
MNAQEILFRIRRFEPAGDRKPEWEEYRLPYGSGMTVLDGLRRLKETVAPSLAWRSSCRMGVCGSCGMSINGRPRLACNTQIAELGSATVVVAPLANFDTVRDLVPDLSPMFEAHAALRPYILRENARQPLEDDQPPQREYAQTPAQLERYLQYSYCIKCGCCMAACPTYATDIRYSGPMPLAQAQRYNADSRDTGFQQRKAVLGGDRGPWRCHYAGECSRVCPKGVDPAKAIQWLRRELVLDALRLRRRRAAAELVEIPQLIHRRPDIPEPPVPTVRGPADRSAGGSS